MHNDDYVERGAILVRLDRRPFEIAVDQMRSDLQQAKLNVDRMVKSLETARAGLEQARDQVQSSSAALEEAWRAVEGQQEQVRSRIAGLRSQAASLRASYAELVLAQKDHERVKNLVTSQTATREELDQKLAALESAREKFKVAEQSVQQARALLALAPDYQHPEQIPADLDRTDTQVRRAVAAGQQILANLGLASGHARHGAGGLARGPDPARRTTPPSRGSTPCRRCGRPRPRSTRRSRCWAARRSTPPGRTSIPAWSGRRRTSTRPS